MIVCYFLQGPTVGLEHREYTVSESEGTKEVCVVVSNYDTLETCPTIDVSLTSVKGTASTYSTYTCMYVACQYLTV